MKILQLTALAAIVATSQVVLPSPVLATSIAQERHSTDLVAQLLGDTRLARLALTHRQNATATKYIESASAVGSKLAQYRHANGESMIVQIYTELDSNASLSGNFAVPVWGTDETTAERLRDLETTYFAIDLDKARRQLDSARTAVRDHNDGSAEKSLAAIRSGLIHGNSTADVPLLTARRELALAQQKINANQPAAASANLERASQALKNYSSVAHTVAAQQLAADIHSSMQVNAKNGPSTAMKIDGWWTSIKRWLSQHA